VFVNNLPTERGESGTTYIKWKEYTIRKPGTYRVSFGLKTAIEGYTVYGRVYKNNVAYGTERTTTFDVYTTFSENLSFATGDKCQLYLKRGGGLGTSSYAVNFKLGVSIYASEDMD
jgi:hypothetical protein